MDNERIVSNPSIKGAKPIIRGTRVPVEVILEELAHTQDVASVAATFQVSREDIVACLEFAAKVVRVHWEAFLANPADID